MYGLTRECENQNEIWKQRFITKNESVLKAFEDK